MFGSFISGFIIGDNKFDIKKSYSIALLVESLQLFIGFMLLSNHIIYGDWFVAMACGTQNGIGTSYSGAIIRTTHMSGIITGINKNYYYRYWEYSWTIFWSSF